MKGAVGVGSTFSIVRPAAPVSNRCKSGIRPVACKEKVKYYLKKVYM